MLEKLKKIHSLGLEDFQRHFVKATGCSPDFCEPKFYKMKKNIGEFFFEELDEDSSERFVESVCGGDFYTGSEVRLKDGSDSRKMTVHKIQKEYVVVKVSTPCGQKEETIKKNLLTVL